MKPARRKLSRSRCPVERVTDDPLKSPAARQRLPKTKTRRPKAASEETDEKPRRGRGRKPSEPRKMELNQIQKEDCQDGGKAVARPGRSTSKRAPAKPGARRAVKDEIEDEEFDRAFERVTDDDRRKTRETF